MAGSPGERGWGVSQNVRCVAGAGVFPIPGRGVTIRRSEDSALATPADSLTGSCTTAGPVRSGGAAYRPAAPVAGRLAVLAPGILDRARRVVGERGGVGRRVADGRQPAQRVVGVGERAAAAVVGG